MGTETMWPNACTDRPRGASFPSARCVRAVVVSGISGQDAAKVRLADDHDMVEAFPPDRADQPLDMAVLPWRARRGWSVADAHGLESPRDDGAVGCIAITDEVSRCFIPRECLGDLPRDPLGRRVCGDVGPDEPAPAEMQDSEAI